MAERVLFEDDFDSFDEQNNWSISDFAINAGFIDTVWSPDNVIVTPGQVSLELNSTNG